MSVFPEHIRKRMNEPDDYPNVDHATRGQLEEEVKHLRKNRDYWHGSCLQAQEHRDGANRDLAHAEARVAELEKVPPITWVPAAWDDYTYGTVGVVMVGVVNKDGHTTGGMSWTAKALPKMNLEFIPIGRFVDEKSAQAAVELYWRQWWALLR